MDTNVIVALADEQDDLHARATKDARTLRRGPFASTSLVLSEACFLLPQGYLRRRMRFLLRGLAVSAVDLDPPWWDEVFTWMERYEEHEPDLADAHLAVLCSRDRSCRVWTYDDDFRKIWRRSDGTRIPLAGRGRPAR